MSPLQQLLQQQQQQQQQVLSLCFTLGWQSDW
jgi:hypothetical protein